MIVLYHANCTDGFCAAWLFWRVYPDATYIPVKYGEAPPEISPGEEVFILDFCYEDPIVMKKIKAESKFLMVLDHHKSNREIAEKYGHFDNTKSGAMLALEYLKREFSENIRWIVNYVQDYDLWKFELYQSREVNATIQSYPQDFEIWNDFEHMWEIETGFNESLLFTEGRAILRYKEGLITALTKKAKLKTIGGVEMPVVCCTVKALVNETLERLAVGQPCAASWEEKDGGRVYSVRSAPNGIDVGAFAKQFGGGGHKHAGGFFFPEEAFDAD